MKPIAPVDDEDAAVIPVVGAPRPKGPIGRNETTSQPAFVMSSVYSRGMESVPTLSSRTWALTPARQRSARASASSRAIGPSS